MPAKMTLSVYDELHQRNAEGIEYDLWRLEDDSKRVNIGHKTLTGDRSQLLVEANSPDELGAFEIVLYVKDYYDRLNEKIEVEDSRHVLGFGLKNPDENSQLAVRITPTGYTCTL